MMMMMMTVTTMNSTVAMLIFCNGNEECESLYIFQFKHVTTSRFEQESNALK